ncbi:hypothetical protein BX616_008491, partial [Lobosporangium transversale]
MTSKKSALDALRSQVLSHTGSEERVEDDAGAKGIEIVFETGSPGRHETAPNLNSKITRVLFKNNGMDFRPEDWNRLKKIAEGNPDESK